MADEKEQGFKVADRRRYNPDGSLREAVAEETTKEESALPAEAPAEIAEEQAEALTEGENADDQAVSAADNVVSFPGASSPPGSGDEEPERTEPKQAAAKVAAASAVSATQAASQQAAQSAQAAQQSAIENAYNQTTGGSANPNMPQASFLSLLNMLGVEAAMHLGLMEMQDGQRTPVDLEAARHMIDMLGMLKEKTRGNLTADEEALLENVLADLRMQFVALSRKG
jgi:hypothetical protein